MELLAEIFRKIVIEHYCENQHWEPTSLLIRF